MELLQRRAGRDEKRRKVLTLCSFECDRSEQLVYSIFTERSVHAC